jgi:hypothetical protein
MHKAFKIGFVAGLIAAAAGNPSGPAFAKKVSSVRKPLVLWYPLNNVRCVERSFSISVGNPAYKNRLAIWPAPCHGASLDADR